MRLEPVLLQVYGQRQDAGTNRNGENSETSFNINDFPRSPTPPSREPLFHRRSPKILQMKNRTDIVENRCFLLTSTPQTVNSDSCVRRAIRVAICQEQSV